MKAAASGGSPLSDERGFRTDVVAAMKELKLSVVRWPGGCFASAYLRVRNIPDSTASQARC